MHLFLAIVSFMSSAVQIIESAKSKDTKTSVTYLIAASLSVLIGLALLNVV